MAETLRVALYRPAADRLIGGHVSRPSFRRQDAEPVMRSDRSKVSLSEMMSARLLQPQLEVGAVDDPFEREADRTADMVMSTGSAQSATLGSHSVSASLSRLAQRAIGKGEAPVKKDEDGDDKKKVQRSPDITTAVEAVPSGIESRIASMSRGGEPLPEAVRSKMERGFAYDFGNVRVHSGPDAAGPSVALGARAFTVENHIFFRPGEFQPATPQGQKLIAHELTHTIQQQPSGSRMFRAMAAPKRVQRSIFDSIGSKLREFITNDFPPWDLITLIIGHDPISQQPVRGATRDWMRAALKLVPDGLDLFNKLDREGKIDAVAKWWDAEVAKLDLTFDKIVALFNRAKDAVGLSDILSPFDAWTKKIKPIFQPTVDRVWNFIKAVGGKILQVVKDVVLKQIGDWAKAVRGYTLLIFILGKDPVTDEEVKRTPKSFVFAVLDLVPGGDKMKENLEKSHAIEKAVAWLQAEVDKLDLTWAKIKELFAKAWDAFHVADLLAPRTLLEKMAGIFGPPLGRLLRFVLAVGKKVLQFIFEGAMMIAGPIGLQIINIVRKVGDTFDKIIADPIGFVGNLVHAIKIGFQQFGKNIWEHLKTGLIEWVVGALEGAGLVLPKVWDLKGILNLVLQVLGITYAKIRAKLVKVIGEDRVAMLERVFDFLKTLVTEGPTAAWQQIVQAIGSLWDLVIGGIKDWAITKIVTAAITKLASMLNPAGAIIQAIIAIYNTVAFFVERIKQILALVEAVVDSIANIANGKLAQAADFVERAMARTIPVILGFLSRLIGLGDPSEPIKKVITFIQEKVDKGIDMAIAWIVEKAKSLLGGGGPQGSPEHAAKWAAGVAGVHSDIRHIEDEKGTVTDQALLQAVPGWKTKYGFVELTVTPEGKQRVLKGAMSDLKAFETLGGNTGDENDPFPIAWPKPHWSSYPTLYLGEPTDEVHSQSEMKRFYDNATDRARMKVRAYRPDRGTNSTMPGGETIGLEEPWKVDLNDRVGPLSTDTTKGGGKINRLLKRYGFDPSAENKDGDHVWEIQVGGKDTLENLWPLDASINRGAGSILKSKEVTLRSGVKKKVGDLKGDVQQKYYFVVREFRP